MSRTYHIVCFETKKSVWIGQGHLASGDFALYSGEEDTMEKLRLFFIENQNKPFYLVDSEVVEDLFQMEEWRVKEILENSWPYIET